MKLFSFIPTWEGRPMSQSNGWISAEIAEIHRRKKIFFTAILEDGTLVHLDPRHGFQLLHQNGPAKGPSIKPAIRGIVVGLPLLLQLGANIGGKYPPARIWLIAIPAAKKFRLPDRNRKVEPLNVWREPEPLCA